MNKTIMGNFRDSTTPNDDIYFLGDFAMGIKLKHPALLKEFTEGRTVFGILGNHDQLKKEVYLQYFKEVHLSLEIELQGHKCLLSHYPYEPLPGEEIGHRNDFRFLDRRPQKVPERFLLHGHSHSTPETRLGEGALDIGIDPWYYRPVSEQTIVPLIEKWKSGNWNT